MLKTVKLFIIIFLALVSSGCKEKGSSIHFLDVGYGDAILINTPQTNILIDTGDKNQSPKVQDYLKSLKISKIDTLFLTHPHPDHIGGFSDIAKEFEIGRIFSERPLDSHELYGEVYRRARDENISSRVLKRGDTLTEDNIYIEVLNPGIITEELNESSLVLKVSVGNTSILLAGDIGSKRCSRLAEIYGDDLKSRILKVPHHGKAGKEDFVRMVSPEIAIISVGPSRWGGPDKEIIQLYDKPGITLLRTDHHGDIKIFPAKLEK